MAVKKKAKREIRDLIKETDFELPEKKKVFYRGVPVQTIRDEMIKKKQKVVKRKPQKLESYARGDMASKINEIIDYL